MILLLCRSQPELFKLLFCFFLVRGWTREKFVVEAVGRGRWICLAAQSSVQRACHDPSVHVKLLLLLLFCYSDVRLVLSTASTACLSCLYIWLLFVSVVGYSFFLSFSLFSFVFVSTACHSRRRSTGGNVSVSCWRNDIRSVSTDSSYSLVLSLQKYAPRPSVCLSVTPQLTVFMYCTIYSRSLSQSVSQVGEVWYKKKEMRYRSVSRR